MKIKKELYIPVTITTNKLPFISIYLSIYLDLGVWGFGVFLFRGRGIRLEGLIGKRIGEGRGVYSDSASIFLVVGMGMVYGQHSTCPPDAFLDTYKTRIMGLLMNS